MTAPSAPASRTERLGRDTLPIVIPAGPAWGPGTSVVSHTQTADPKPVPARHVAINRIIGPTVVHPPAVSEPPTGPATPESTLAPVATPFASAAASPRAPDDAPATPSPGPVLVLLMAGAGLSMAGAGLQVLSRRSA